MVYQEPPQPSLGNNLIERIIFYLNYPFINQKEFKVSILSLLLLVLVILAAVALSRYVRRFLEKRVLPRFHLDPGLQYALLRVVKYLIVAAGVLYALKVGLAIDLTSVAVILGFLSVGIGFGLQYIASDLISGVILLFERPVRVGDHVKAGEVEGRVYKVHIRSTIIVTNDNITVVVPNSNLVRNQLINWSYSNPVRIKIPVGVAYASDVNQVTEALIEAARSVEKVSSARPPKVYLKGFGDSSIDFELLVWIDEPHNHPQIRSDINYQIHRLFGQYQIEIPYPQRDLRLRAGSLRLSQDELGISRLETLSGPTTEGGLGESEAAREPRR